MITAFFTTTDNTDLYYRHFSATNEKAVVLFVGGIESHGGWYENSLEHLKEGGVTSYFLDRRGSGRSQGRKGDVLSLERLRSDLEEFSEFVKKNHPAKPLVLSAISWGAKLALSLWF